MNTTDPNDHTSPREVTAPPRGRAAYLVVHGNAYAFLDEATGDTSVGNVGHAPLLDDGTPDWGSFVEPEPRGLDCRLEQVLITAAEALRTAIAAHNAWLIS